MPEDIKPVENKPVKDEAASAEVKTDKPAAAAGGTAPKKKDNTLKIVLIIVGVVVGLGVLGVIASIVFFGALFNSVNDNVDVDDGTVTIQTDEGEVKTNVGEDAQLADGFPSDVPIYEPSSVKGSTKVDNTQFSAVAATSKSVAEVAAFYKSEMVAQGWTIEYDSTSTDSTLLTFKKDNRTSSVVITTNSDGSTDEKTGFVVSVTTQE